MATPKGNYDWEVIKYQQAHIAESKKKYYMRLSNTITNFNYNNNTPLSNVNIQELVLGVTREDGEGSIKDANNVTANTCSHASSSQRENLKTIFTSEKIENQTS